MKLAVTFLWIAMMASPTYAADVLLYAAGSLRGALTEVATAFEAASGDKVVAKYGPSGTLKDVIAAGERAEVFASANMEHPQALAAAGKSSPVVLFARSRLCALVRPGLAVTPETLLDTMLRADVKVGTSTPKADPSGDYAFEVFRKADALKPGSRAALEAKAQQLTGSASAAPPPAGRNPYGWPVAEGRADVFLNYCTAATVAAPETPASRSWRARTHSRSAPTTASPDERRRAGGAPVRTVHPRRARPGHPGAAWLRAAACSPSGIDRLGQVSIKESFTN